MQTLIDDEGSKHLSEPRKSVSIACGATVFEVSMKVPSWASQVVQSLLFIFFYEVVFLILYSGLESVHS